MKKKITIFVSVFWLLSACQQDLPLTGDPRDSSFLLNGKADGFSIMEGSREALGILKLVNTASNTLLSEKAGIEHQAADAIYFHRLGPDRIEHTNDDDPFDRLRELDAIDFVGWKTADKLLDYARKNGYVDDWQPNPAMRLRHSHLVISEFVSRCNFLNSETDQFVELYNAGPVPVDVAGYILSDDDQDDVIQAWPGGESVIPPGTFGVILDRDHLDTWNLPPNAVRLTVGDAQLGNRLAQDDPVLLVDPTGGYLVDGSQRHMRPESDLSLVRTTLVHEDDAHVWEPSPCYYGETLNPGATPGYLACDSFLVAFGHDKTLGEACPNGAVDCESGICLIDPLNSDTMCSLDCSQRACPADYRCRHITEDAWTGHPDVCVPDTGCHIDLQLGSDLGQLVYGETTEGAQNRYFGTCGGDAAGEITMAWTAPEDGEYTFTALSESYTSNYTYMTCPVLLALDAECSSELACDNTGELGTPRALTLSLQQGESIVLAMDSFCESSPFFFDLFAEKAEPSVCPDQVISSESLPIVLEGDTTGGGNQRQGSCGGEQAPEHEYSFTAPFAGRYTIDTLGSVLNTVLYVRKSDCDGDELACNDNTDQTYQSAVNLDLQQGQRVVVVVDGADGRQGPFLLTIDLAEEPATCPLQDLGGTLQAQAAMGSTAGHENAHAGSCGGWAAPDAAYGWTAPHDGRFVFDTFGSSLSSVLYAKDGSCDGAELGCNDEAGGGHQSELTLDLQAGQFIVLVVDGYKTYTGDFVLNITEESAPPPPPPPGDCPYDDLTDWALRQAMYDDIKHQQVIGYDNARRFMFASLDNQNGSVRCVYTGTWVQTSGIPDHLVMNTEHTWPKSGGPTNPATLSDLHHLFPTTHESNTKRKSYPFGEVKHIVWQDGGSRLGYDSSNHLVFEPRDDHKGDVARALFYFAVRYESSLPNWEEDVLKQWNRQDPPSDWEQTRNQKIEQRQGNSNPFVEYPACANRINDF